MSRLIDADALKDRLQSLAYDDWNQGVSTSWADAYRECADMVDEQPTIEPERKKGKWIYKNDLKQYFCSECGFPSLTYDDVYIYSMDLPNFCEDCGADMRGE